MHYVFISIIPFSRTYSKSNKIGQFRWFPDKYRHKEKFAVCGIEKEEKDFKLMYKNGKITAIGTHGNAIMAMERYLNLSLTYKSLKNPYLVKFAYILVTPSTIPTDQFVNYTSSYRPCYTYKGQPDFSASSFSANSLSKYENIYLFNSPLLLELYCFSSHRCSSPFGCQ